MWKGCNTLDIDGLRHFDPYVNEFGLQGTFDLPFAVNGELTDANGLVHLRARYYNPELGTFAALDLFEGLVDEPMSLNGHRTVQLLWLAVINYTKRRYNQAAPTERVMNVTGRPTLANSLNEMRYPARSAMPAVIRLVSPLMIKPLPPIAAPIDNA